MSKNSSHQRKQTLEGWLLQQKKKGYKPKQQPKIDIYNNQELLIKKSY